MAVTVTDNDSLVSFDTNMVTVAEDAGTATVTINRDGPLTLTNTVTYTIRSGTATTADYTASNGTLTFLPGESADSHGLTGKELYSIEDLKTGAREVTVVVEQDGGGEKQFKATVRVDTPKEWEYYNNGGILHYVLRQLAA